MEEAMGEGMIGTLTDQMSLQQSLKPVACVTVLLRCSMVVMIFIILKLRDTHTHQNLSICVVFSPIEIHIKPQETKRCCLSVRVSLLSTKPDTS